MAKRWSNRARATIRRLLEQRDGRRCGICGMVPGPGQELPIDHRDEDAVNDAPANLQLLCRACNTAKQDRYRMTTKAKVQSEAGRASSGRGHPVTTGGPAPQREGPVEAVKRMLSSGRGAKERLRDPVGRSAGAKPRDAPKPSPGDRTRESVWEGGDDWEPEIGKDVDYALGSAEMQAHDLLLRRFRFWLLGQVRVRGSIPRNEAAEAGAMRLGCSVATTMRYCNMLSSSEGPLERWRNPHASMRVELVPREAEGVVTREQGK